MDRMILDELQFRFPVTDRPYRTIARRLGLAEDIVIARAKALENRGVIRYTGILFDLNKLGAVSTLAALSVPPADIERVSQIINNYPNVSHNYLRKGDYNMWFTVSAPSKKRLKQIIREIRQSAGCGRALELDTQHVFKAKAVFRMAS
jgi:DNA-binding Lrp family transcriptional regulator